MIESPLRASDLKEFHDSVIPYFNAIWSRAEENERYKSVDHWSASQKQAIEDQGRVAYSIPLISQKVNQILSSQKRNRTEYKLEAFIDNQDEIKAELGTFQFKDLEKRCKFRYLESEVLDSGVAVAYGAAEIYLDTDDDLNVIPNVREIDYKELIWDANSKEYDKSDALFMAKMRKAYRYQIKEEYGEEAGKVGEYDERTWGREKQAYYSSINYDDRDFDIITVFEHYQKVVRTYYNVLFNDYLDLNGKKGKVVCYKVRDKAEAERLLRELKLPYLLGGEVLAEHSIEQTREVRLDKYVFTYERVLEYEETELEKFPFAVYQAYHYKDKIWTLTDVLKSAQKFIDRYIAQIDYSFGKDIKNAYEVVVSKLADGFNLEMALQRLEEDGILPVKAEGAIRNVRSQGANPQWIQMVGVMQNYLEDLAGGRSFQGLSESADESGKAIKLKQLQGELVTVQFQDNLMRWKQDLGEKLLWWFKTYDTSERIVKIAGTELKPEMAMELMKMNILKPSKHSRNEAYVKINRGNTSHLRDAKVELVVSQTGLSDTEKEKKLVQLMEAARLNPTLAQLPKFTEKLLEYSGLNFSDRQELIAEYKGMMQTQMAQAQADKQSEQNIEKAKIVASLMDAKGENKFEGQGSRVN